MSVNKGIEKRQATPASPQAEDSGHSGEAGKKVPHECSHESIAERAYLIWLEWGTPDGQDVACWLEAEAELRIGLKPSLD